jgi:hypothetical protein
MNPGASAQPLSGRVAVSCFYVSLLSIGSVMMCVLVYKSLEPIEIFFTSLCPAMSFICGSGSCSVTCSVIDGGMSSCIYSEGRPIGSLMRFGPIKKSRPCDLLFLCDVVVGITCSKLDWL